jgi:hypothetical protein
VIDLTFITLDDDEHTVRGDSKGKLLDVLIAALLKHDIMNQEQVDNYKASLRAHIKDRKERQERGEAAMADAPSE